VTICIKAKNLKDKVLVFQVTVQANQRQIIA